MMSSIGKPFSRRGLLIAGVAGALVAPAKARKIRVAVLGIGHAHAMGKVRALRSMDEFELAGVCEPDVGQSREHEALQGVKWLSESEVLGDGGIELVAVESRVQENLDYARKCIDAGKYVHLDKPPGEDLGALERLLENAGRKNLVVQMGYQWRYHAAMQAAIEAARKGWLGDIYMVRATINKPISRETRIELAEFKGGMMFELGCHMIDRVVALLGKPRNVTGRLRHDSPVDDTLADNTLAVLEYDNALAEVYVAAMQPHGGNYRTLEILGTNGTATVRPFSPLRLQLDLGDPAGPYSSGVQDVPLTPPPGPAFAPDLRELAAVIREGAKPTYSPEHDLAVQEVLLKACGMV
jgi:predicted dehydrogenase